MFKAPPTGDIDSSLVSQVANSLAIPVGSPVASNPAPGPPLPAASVDVSSLGEVTPGPSLTPVLGGLPGLWGASFLSLPLHWTLLLVLWVSRWFGLFG